MCFLQPILQYVICVLDLIDFFQLLLTPWNETPSLLLLILLWHFLSLSYLFKVLHQRSQVVFLKHVINNVHNHVIIPRVDPVFTHHIVLLRWLSSFTELFPFEPQHLKDESTLLNIRDGLFDCVIRESQLMEFGISRVHHYILQDLNYDLQSSHEFLV